MKKYKVYVTYHFVGGTMTTFIVDRERTSDITEEELESVIEGLLDKSYIHQTYKNGASVVNLANVTSIDIEFKEVEDEEV